LPAVYVYDRDVALGECGAAFIEASNSPELTATLAWENYRARFDHAFGVEAEGFTQGSYCAMPARGSAKLTEPN